MIRLVVRTGIMLAANAVGLIVASLVLSGFEIDVTSFIIAVVIFTVVLALMTPFLASSMRRGGSNAALGGVALIATLVVADHHRSHLRRVLDRRHRQLACGRGHRLGRIAPCGVHPAVPGPQEVHREQTA